MHTLAIVAWLLWPAAAHAQEFALATPPDDFSPTIADASRWIEAPTGKHGFVQARGERFVFQDGTPVRFWGAQISLWDQRQIDYTARRMRRQGINIVRLHALGQLNGRQARSILAFDAEAFDRLDYTVAKLGENGIYLILDTDYPLNTRFGPDDAVPGLPQGGPLPYAEFFNARVAELKRQRMKAIYTHLNPYTKKRYCDDPTLALVEIHNEDSMFFYGVDSLPQLYKDELDERFRKWLRAEKPVERIRISAFRESSLRQHPEWRKLGEDQLRFYLELEDEYFLGGRKLLREIGVKVPICGTNWLGGGFTTRVHLYGQSKLDYIDRHGYWDHPQGEGNLKWRISTCRFHNLPMVKDLAAGPDPQQENNVGNLVTRNAWQRVLGAPLTISEWNTCMPNQHALEGTGILPAYGLLQGWNGLLQFAYTSPDWPGRVTESSFDLLGNAPQILQFPAVAAMWYRGDVREAELLAEIVHAKEEVTRFADEKLPVAIAGALVGKVGYRFGGGPAVARDLGKYWDPKSRVARSATGEMVWDAGRGLVTIDTPRTQAVIGFLSAQPHRLKDVEMDLTSEFGAVWVTALDGLEPVARARTLLVTAVGPVRNTGMEYERTAERAARFDGPLWKLVGSGQPPMLMRAVTGEIRIRTARAGGLKAWALDVNGKRTGAVALESGETLVRLKLTLAGAAPYYELGP